MQLKKTFLSLLITSVMATPSMPLFSAPLQLTDTVVKQEQILSSNTWIEVNLKQFRDNIKQFKSQIKSGVKVCAVMKSDAYGNGIEGLMPIVIEENIPCVAIASNAEATAVRNSGFKGQLMRVRSANIDEMKAAIELDIEELVGTTEQADALSKLSEKIGKEIKIHVALNDGGMGRNGIDMTTNQGKQEALEVSHKRGVNVVGIMTHFPNYNSDEIRQKLTSFESNSAWLIEKANLKRENVLLHVANSYTALAVPEAQLDMVRPGGVLYGDLPTNPEYPSIISFKTRIASLHHLPKNSTVGYDSSYKTDKASVMANIPVGYSDGYPRKMGNTAEVLINGQRAKVAGVVSMNTTMVDVTDLKGVKPGSEVVLFGSQLGKIITATEMEKNSEVILPELYTIWGSANPRLYVE
ncbi:alanine racemase [Vibrio harveyi]|uniref:alanine racemase n=1 Tax=Vibrio harveyi TaxID=669 RepID=UPI0036F40CB5